MTDKEYYENRAIDLLKEYFGFQNFINLDKPDLQSTEDDMGVEVRRAIDTEDGKREGFVNANFTSGKTIDEKNEQLSKRKVKGKIIDLGFAHTLIPDKYGEVGYLEEGYKKIVESFLEKLSKLNVGGYKHYKTNALFLFCEHANDQWEINHIINEINDELKKLTNTTNILFDVIFFDTIQHLYKVEYNKSSNRYHLSESKDKSPH